ncbi:MAG: hypothetical protein R8G66_25775 [Cytophagales bacterium]|nr:hypothetical protein [Cytophagales bacterium]
MSKEQTGKYAPGEIVFSKVYPGEKLKIRRYVSRVYYCQFVDDENRKELALFEREIEENK